MLIDSHAHLNFADFEGRVPEMIVQAKEAGVEKIINIGASLEDSEKAVRLAQTYPELYATVGVHPNDDTSVNVENVDWRKFERLARDPSAALGIKKIVAIGETGLDFSRLDANRAEVTYNDRHKQGTHKAKGQHEKERQKELFLKQIEIAKKLDLPLSIHIRDAQTDVMEQFAKTLRNWRGAFHCFSGDQVYLDYILRQLPDFYISFAGNVTFRNAKELQELAKLVPLDRLLVETDCPYLSPEPYRGVQNVPANVKITAQKLAEIKSMSLEEISEITSKNATELFAL